MSLVYSADSLTSPSNLLGSDSGTERPPLVMAAHGVDQGVAESIQTTHSPTAFTGEVAYSRGFGKYDNTPEQRSAPNAEAFLAAICQDRGKAKGQQWISGPFDVAELDALHIEHFTKAIGSPHRCSNCVLPCSWLGFDIDKGMTPQTFEFLQSYLRKEGVLGVIYTTASHTTANPRCRIILMLDRPLPRAERIQALLAMRARLDQALLNSGCEPVTWDTSCDIPEQPLYLPLEQSQLVQLDGQPLSADRLLAEGLVPNRSGTKRADCRTVAQCLIDGEGNHPTMLVMVARMIRAKIDDDTIHVAVQAQPWERDMPRAEVQRAIDGARGKLRGGEWKSTQESAFDDERHLVGAPEPLRRPTPPAEPYPLHALGSVLQPAALAIQRVVQAPDAIIGGSLLAAASLAVQAQADVHIDGRVHPLSLWLLSVAASGERKSAVDLQAMRAAHEHERTLTAAYVVDLEIYHANLAEWEAKRDAAKSEAKKAKGVGLADRLRTLGPPPPAPLLPRVTVADFTAEGIFKLLSLGKPALGAFTDEAALVFGGHGMTKESVMRTAGTLSKLWDSGSLDRVRSGDGAQKLYGRRLALHLLAQPVIAERALSDDVLAGQGFMARCLLAWPQSTAGTRSYCTETLLDDPGMQHLTSVLLERHRLPLPLADGEQQALQPRALRLTSEAMAAWVELHNAIEVEMRPEGKLSTIQPWASKTPEQALRIAGVLTLLDDEGATTIDRATVERAIKLARWHLNEALRLAGTAEVSPGILDAEALLNWAQANGRRFVYSREVLQFGPNRIRERAAFQRAIAELVAAGWAVPIEGGMRLNGAHRRYVWCFHSITESLA